jgi:hypothetical protein
MGPVGSDGGGAGSPVGDGGSSGAGASDGIDIDRFCELQARGRQWLLDCRPGFADSSGWWGTRNIDRFCTSARSAIEAGRLHYDPVQAEACFSESVGDCDSIAAFRVSGPCLTVVTGAVPLGEACHADGTEYGDECADGFCAGDTCPGVCTSYAKAGESCGAGSPCEPSAHFCNDAGKCEAYAALGAPCAAAQCRPDLRCRANAQQQEVCSLPLALGDACLADPDECPSMSACYQGTCVAALPLGEPCELDDCGDGAYCDQVCKARVPIDGDCGTAGYCVEGAQCEEGVCIAFGKPGDACPCASGLWCDGSNQCRAQGALGDDCGDTTTAGLAQRCAPPLMCEPGALGPSVPTDFTCQPRRAKGEPCVPETGSCELPLWCDFTSNTCQEPGGQDADCDVRLLHDSCRLGLFCECTGDCEPGQPSPGKCHRPLPDGAACTLWSSCESQQCLSTQCVPICL